MLSCSSSSSLLAVMIFVPFFVVTVSELILAFVAADPSCPSRCMLVGWLVVRCCLVSACPDASALSRLTAGERGCGAFGIGNADLAAAVVGEVAIGDMGGCGAAIVVGGAAVAPSGSDSVVACGPLVVAGCPLLVAACPVLVIVCVSASPVAALSVCVPNANVALAFANGSVPGCILSAIVTVVHG